MNEQPKTRWQRFKAGLSEYHSRTLLGFALGPSTKEQWEAHQKEVFEKGKRVSDFVGMLLRLGFLFLAFLYLSQLSKAEGPLSVKGITLGMAAFFSLSLYFIMVYHIWAIVSAYFDSDTAHWKTKAGKIPIIVLGILQTGVFVFGVTTLAQSIAKSSLMLNSPAASQQDPK